jgi:hypothetical protein
MSFTNDLENSVLNYFFTSTADASLAIPKPSVWYLALFTDSSLTDASTPTEASGTGYVRKAVTFTVSGNTASNSGAVEWPAAGTGGWGTIYYVGVYDASSAGNLLTFAALTVSKAVGEGDTIRIPDGDLDITLD